MNLPKLHAIKLTLGGKKEVYGQQSARHLFVFHKIHVLVLCTQKKDFTKLPTIHCNTSKGVKVMKARYLPTNSKTLSAQTRIS